MVPYASRGDLGVLPHAQPCAFGGGARIEERFGIGGGGSPSPVHAIRELPGGMERGICGKVASNPMLWTNRISSPRCGYIELNPVRAKLVSNPADYPCISAAAHVEGREERLIVASPLREMVGDWREFLNSGIGTDDAEILRLHERTGRPLGSDDFITRLENPACQNIAQAKTRTKEN